MRVPSLIAKFRTSNEPSAAGARARFGHRRFFVRAAALAALAFAFARFLVGMDFFPAERRDIERTVASLHDSDHRLFEHDFGDFDPPGQQRQQLQVRINVARLDERLARDIGIVGDLHTRHVGHDSPAETHLDVVGMNLPTERGTDLVEDVLAALGDDRVEVSGGVEEDRAGENNDGSNNCGGDYDDTTHRTTFTSATSERLATRPQV